MMGHYVRKTPQIKYDMGSLLRYSLSEFRELSICFNGTVCNIVQISDADFRTWLDGIMDQLEISGRTSAELRELRKDCKKQQMDEQMRWYAVNEIVRLRRFRRSGIQLFVEACA